MDVLSLLINAAIAVGTIGAVVVALFLGHRQRADSLEAQYDAQRPIIAPDQPQPHFISTPGPLGVIELPREPAFDLTVANNLIRLTNVGAGVAINVRGVVFGPEPTEPGATPTPYHSLAAVAPQPPGAPLAVVSKPGGLTVHGTDEIVPGYTLYAPLQSLLGGITASPKYRLTLTYHDLFGRIHAVIYDYTWSNVWAMRKLAHPIKKDLDGVDRAAIIRARSGPEHVGNQQGDRPAL
jgi:hypothetical protein